MYKYQMVYSSLKRLICNEKSIGDTLRTDEEYAKYYNVSKITIKKAMRQLYTEGYVERKSGMKTKVLSTGMVKKRYSLILPDYSNAFGEDIVKNFELWCLRNKYIPIVSRTFDDIEFEKETIRNHLIMDTNGIVMMPTHIEYFNKELMELSNNHFPIVTIDRRINYLPIPVVKSNATQDTIKIINYIKSKAPKQIFIVTPPLDKQTPIYDRMKTLIAKLEKLEFQYSIVYTEACVGDVRNRSERNEILKLKKSLDKENPKEQLVVCLYFELACLVEEILSFKNNSIEIICFDAPTAGNNRFTHIKQSEKEIIEKALELLQDSEKIKMEEILINGDLILKN